MSGNNNVVSLRLFGALRDAAGKREVELACAGGTVKEALVQFVSETGNDVGRFIFDDRGNQWRSLMLLLNDEPVEDAEETVLKAGDVVSLLLPLAGG
jgi:molybdopterin converting factor small subunit